MTAPAASDLARAMEALGYAEKHMQSAFLSADEALAVVIALRSREQEIAEAARWKAVADELAGALRRVEYASGEYGGECPVCAFEKDWPERHDPEGCELAETLARYDAARKESGDA